MIWQILHPLYVYSNLIQQKKDISFTVPFSSLGPSLPKSLLSLTMLEIHGDAFIFGGFGGDYNSHSVIYQITCSFGICSVATINQELIVARYNAVAIPVSDTFCV